MNRFNKRLTDSIVGNQDERERLETYERLTLFFAYIYWGALLLGAVSYIIDWDMGKAALLLWVLLGIPVFGWNKFNDLSGACVSEADHITPETAKGVLKKAWKQSLSFAGGLSCAIFLMMKDKSPNSPNALILIFTGLIFLLSAIGVYSSVSMRVKRALRELHQED